MAQLEFLEELKKHTLAERLAIVEAALHWIREDLKRKDQSLAGMEKKRQLAAAAKTLLPDYAANGDLTAFTDLDSEDFYAER